MIEEELKAAIKRLEISSDVCADRVLLDTSRCLAKAMLELLDRTGKIEDRLPFRPTGCGPL